MSFKYPKDARDYFKLIDNQSDDNRRFKTLFDKYYLCLMLGLDRTKRASEDKVEGTEFIDYYPLEFADKSEIIAALLIDAEMRYQAIEAEDRESVQKLILKLVDQTSGTRLSKEGIKYLNLYAAGGMTLIRDNIPKTYDIEAFLVQYYELINQRE